MHYSILPAAALTLFAASPLIAEDATPDVAAKAAQIVPSRQQLEWQRMEFIAFAHFGNEHVHQPRNGARATRTPSCSTRPSSTPGNG